MVGLLPRAVVGAGDPFFRDICYWAFILGLWKTTIDDDVLEAFKHSKKLTPLLIFVPLTEDV